MNVQLSDHSQRYIFAQIQSGRYRSEDELLEAAVHLLIERDPASGETKIIDEGDSTAVDQELQRRLFDQGLLSEIKPSSRETGDRRPFTPIKIQGEPLSETVIRERR